MSASAAPLVITVAPNGARKIKADHPAIPLSAAELAEEAAACHAAGATMIHLHVRDDNQGHSLDVARYREATSAIRSRVGADMIIQVTTEAVGIYSPAEQMAVVRELRPEAASLAVRELCATSDAEEEAGAFFAWLRENGVAAQYILYSPEDVARFDDLHRRGVIPGERPSVLYVLGRYSADGQSSPQDLLPLLNASESDVSWSVCAFGAMEAACMLTAAGLGGHCRVGFENNMDLSDGRRAPGNAALVRQVADACQVMGRRVATVNEARRAMGVQ